MTKIQDLPEKEFFTPKEAAYHVDVDETTVCRWCKSGYWIGRKPKGRWNVSRESIVKYLSFFAVLLMLTLAGAEFLPNTRKEHAKKIEVMQAIVAPILFKRKR